MLISSGADASVRVVYKPVQRRREQTGFIAKNVLYTYKQVTEITNNRSEAARVTFTDQIPHSKNEKLKVNRSHRVAYIKTSWLVVAVSLVLDYHVRLPHVWAALACDKFLARVECLS